MAFRSAAPQLCLILLALQQWAAFAKKEGVPEDQQEQTEDPFSDQGFQPGTFAIYVAELIGTLAGLAWGLYASLPTFG